jgi:ubiquinone/menaquinone biosynthesis C-methylase UbiE
MASILFRVLNFVWLKEFIELAYWKITRITNKKLSNAHYKEFYTRYFSLSEDFYDDKRILDIGCGPRGSLEWANTAKERIGIDPLAHQYLKMGAKEHRMTYVSGYLEKLPFADHYFDVICSFNSIDHVDDLATCCNEIKRTLKEDGLFLLIVDVHSVPTVTEPQTIDWNFISHYFPEFEVLDEKRLERLVRYKIYGNVRAGKAIDGNPEVGVLTAKLKKRRA